MCVIPQEENRLQEARLNLKAEQRYMYNISDVLCFNVHIIIILLRTCTTVSPVSDQWYLNITCQIF